MIPTSADLLALLDELDRGKTADDLETQWLEFKPWRDPRQAMQVATEIAVCFANGDGGLLVLGVADRTKGRAKAISGAGSLDADTFRRGIYDSTRPQLDTEVCELQVPEGMLVLVRVAKGHDPPYGTAQGVFKRRIGKNCMPMDAQSFQRVQIASGAVDWSGHPSEVPTSRFDPIEVARARRLLRLANPTSQLVELPDADFLVGLGAASSGKLTHAGVLLFAHAEDRQRLCPQHRCTMSSRPPGLTLRATTA